MDQLIRMNAETYAEHWSDESARFEKQDLYSTLAKISPKERVIEIGCGNGFETRQLASDREVLVIDNNRFLLQKAMENNSGNSNITFMEADIFSLSADQAKQILDFSPHGIVAWLMGSDPDTVESRTPTNTALSERPKLYREAVEDLLVIEPLCTPSVKWIHLANRVGIDAAATDRQIYDATTQDYENYMLSKTKFKVSDVKVIDWAQASGGFMYASAQNINFNASSVRSCIVSILATR
jgi:ubiquinone/menaquinone biosynthesis C-methylase UbiE